MKKPLNIEKWSFGKEYPAQHHFIITTKSGEFIGTKESEIDAARICKIHNRALKK